MATRLTRSQLARRWGVSRAAVSAMWSKPDAPVFDRSGLIDLQAAELYREKSKSQDKASPDIGIAEIKKRRELVKLERERAELARTMGQLVPLDEVTAARAAEGAMIRMDLLALPNMLAPKLDGRTPGEAKKIIDQTVRDMLTAWSRAAGTECPPQ